MVPVVAEIAEAQQDTFAVAKVDVHESGETTRAYGVRGTPTYIVFQGGEIVGRFVGLQTKERFVNNVLRVITVE